MAGQYFLSFSLCAVLVVMATAAPSKDKDMGMFPMENYEQYMPKQQREFEELALKSTGATFFNGVSAGSTGSGADSDSDSSDSKAKGYNMFNPQGKYKKFMPRLEQKWMEKFAGGAAGGAFSGGAAGGKQLKA